MTVIVPLIDTDSHYCTDPTLLMDDANMTSHEATQQAKQLKILELSSD